MSVSPHTGSAMSEDWRHRVVPARSLVGFRSVQLLVTTACKPEPPVSQVAPWACL